MCTFSLTGWPGVKFKGTKLVLGGELWLMRLYRALTIGVTAGIIAEFLVSRNVLADHTTWSMIGYWHHSVVCLSVRL